MAHALTFIAKSPSLELSLFNSLVFLSLPVGCHIFIRGHAMIIVYALKILKVRSLGSISSNSKQSPFDVLEMLDMKMN
jgi:hypothetical protein